jgi:hypothetical protein
MYEESMSKKYLTSYGEYYFEISVNHFSEFLDFNEKLKNTWSEIDKISERYDVDGNDEDSNEIDRLINIAAGFRYDRDASGHISIIFAAMCLETIINHYAILRSSNKYFENYLDKLDVKSKWIVIPKLFINVEFNRDSQAFEFLGKLMTLRNELVHYKPKIIEYTFTSSKKIKKEEDENVTNVKNSIKAMIHVIEELRRIDPKWEEYKWYSHLQKEYSEILKYIK